MYEQLKLALLWLLRVPPEPHDPMGDVQSLRVFRAAPGYLHYITLRWLIFQLALLAGGLIVFIPLLFASAPSGLLSILAIVLGLVALLAFVGQAALTYFSLRLNYEMRWYKVTDRSLRIRAGVWNVHEMTMTFANVQNISITQGPLERLFGISNVRVQTAGGGSQGGSHGKGGGLSSSLHTAVFRGVDDAEEIRDLMLERLRRVRGAGLGDLDDAHPMAASPAHAVFGAEAEMVNLLAALRDEARALRRVTEAAGSIGGLQ
jgi:membrane protein YdbS with pleckstrin-like domain